MDEDNGRWIPDGRKGMQSPGKIENLKKKIHTRGSKVIYHGIGNFVWASGSERGEVRGSRKKFSEGEEGSKDE